ncbi:hypothetical protein ACFL6O_02670 [candidate division KSB1 bacterium]
MQSQSPQVFGILEKINHQFFLKPLFQSIQFFCGIAFVNIFRYDGHIIVHYKDKPRDSPFDRPVILHLCNGYIVTIRDVSVTMRKYPDIDISLIHHFQ